jgi:hypothetical protein
MAVLARARSSGSSLKSSAYAGGQRYPLKAVGARVTFAVVPERPLTTDDIRDLSDEDRQLLEQHLNTVRPFWRMRYLAHLAWHGFLTFVIFVGGSVLWFGVTVGAAGTAGVRGVTGDEPRWTIVFLAVPPVGVFLYVRYARRILRGLWRWPNWYGG